MIKVLKKELIIYIVLLVILIVSMHPDLLSNPTVRLSLMQEKSNYIHPVLYTLLVYIIIGILRIITEFVKKLFKKK